jgi:hypothetical protein
VALRGRWELVGADRQVGDAVVVVRMVVSAEAGYLITFAGLPVTRSKRNDGGSRSITSTPP